MQEKQVYYLIANTPVHAGGNEQLDIIDLPIQRERHTKYPKIEASSLKGTLRSVFPNEIIDDKQNLDVIKLLFGGESTVQDQAGSLGITDARILLFPVKSIKNSFVWVTSPTALQRYFRVIKGEVIKDILLNLEELEDKKLPLVPEESTVFISENEKQGMMLLEEYTFKAKKSKGVTGIAEYLASHVFKADNMQTKFWYEKLKKDLVILSDEDFEYFIVNSTEVITRIQINPKTKTVNEGALFNEEYLPEDTILYFIVTPIPVPQYRKTKEEILELFKTYKPSFIQIGANATLGKGFMELVEH